MYCWEHISLCNQFINYSFHPMKIGFQHTRTTRLIAYYSESAVKNIEKLAEHMVEIKIYCD